MHFHFTEEDYSTHERARDIRAALIYARQRVTVGRLGEPPPSGADVWMYGIGIAGSPPIAAQSTAQLLQSSAKIALFQLCDAPSFCFEQVPAAVAERAALFLRNHWPKDLASIPSAYRDRMGLLPPMLKAMPPRPGRDLADRNESSIFYGTRTGMANLAGGKNAREECVRLMLDSGLPFRGGIVPHSDPRYVTDPKLIIPKISGKQHQALLADTKLCLAPWGNHPITYRLFEGLATRCLVIGQSLRDTTFIDAGLEANRDYVEVAPDLSDLTQKVKYYLEHLDEAQRIADAGHETFKRFLASRGRLISKHVFDQTVASWGSLYRSAPENGPIFAVRSLLVKQFPKLIGG